jgi:hypothetical protein
MPVWLQYLLAVAGLAIAGPLIALGARRYGGRLRGGAGMVGLLLGLGEAADPGKRHLIEAMEQKRRDAPAPGDPPAP